MSKQSPVQKQKTARNRANIRYEALEAHASKQTQLRRMAERALLQVQNQAKADEAEAYMRRQDELAAKWAALKAAKAAGEDALLALRTSRRGRRRIGRLVRPVDMPTVASLAAHVAEPPTSPEDLQLLQRRLGKLRQDQNDTDTWGDTGMSPREQEDLFEEVEEIEARMKEVWVIPSMPPQGCWVGEYLAGKVAKRHDYPITEARIEEIVDALYGIPDPKVRREVSKGISTARAKARGWAESIVLSVYNPESGDTAGVLVRYDRITGPKGLIQSLYGQKVALPIIQVLNNQRLDEKGRRPPIPQDIIRGARDAGYFLVKDCWLIESSVFQDLRKTLPTDIDIRGYINGLCAPMIHVGTHSVTVRSRTAVMGYGIGGVPIEIPAQCDGAGGISPNHPIWDEMGVARGKRRWIQIRIWNPQTGVFLKGLLVADDRCKDDHGDPDIWCDWLQVKGSHKALAKQRAKEGKIARLEGMTIGVMRSFDREQHQWANAQILQFAADTEENRRRIDTFLEEFFQGLSLEKLLAQVQVRNDFIRNVVRVCQACGEDPLTNVLVREAFNEKLKTVLYRASQGAALRGDCFGVVMDASLKPGECVVAPVKDKEGKSHYRVGDVIAYSRAPGLLPSCLGTLWLVEPKPHMLVEEGGRLVAPKGTMFVCPKEAQRTQLDDDGDVLVAWWDERVVDLFDTRISVTGFGGPDDVYLVEPEKTTSNIIGGHAWGSEEFYSFVALDGKGPIGPVTLASQMWLALGEPGEYLASVLWLQAAVDQEKRSSRVANPNTAKDPANWVEAEEYDRVVGPNGETVKVTAWKYNPPANGWISDRSVCTGEGLLDGEKLFKYTQRRALKMGHVGGYDQKGRPVGVKIPQVLTWRKEGKVIDPTSWFEEPFTGKDQNLVHYCAYEAWKGFQIWARENIPPRSSKRLTRMLLDQMGMEVNPLPEQPYIMGLRVRAGIKAYREAVGQVMRKMGEVEDKEALFLAIESQFHLELAKLSLEECLQIWTTELMLANEHRQNPVERNGHLKLAFQAVTFPGSPVLKALGVVMEAECQFMDSAKLEAVAAKARDLLGRVDLEGRKLFRDIPEVLYRMTYGPYGQIPGSQTILVEPKLHLVKTGIPFADCEVCQRKVLALSVRLTRAKQGTAVQEAAGRLVTGIRKYRANL